jgi:predicted component of viral defense system (DUF524 family)
VAEKKQRACVECYTSEGRLLATVEIVTPRNSTTLPIEQHPLVLLSVDEARQNGEENLQLRERGRYEYLLRPAVGAPDDLALLPQRGVQPSQVRSAGEDRGVIEPQDHCGLFPLIVIRRGDATQQPLARGSVEVRSLKLGYRDHYRGMLLFIAEKCAGLLLDSRAPTRLRLDTLWQIDSRILEQQLEFLRYTLESPNFRTAIDEVLRNPHHRLEAEPEMQNISRPFKTGKSFTRQIAMASWRIALPSTHPLYPAIKSLPTQVAVQSRTDFLDTAENRFAKLVLVEFRDFLAEVSTHLTRKIVKDRQPETQRLLRETKRLRGMLETQLARGFFPSISPPTMLPLGSPALQQKAGYRELFRFWLQFHAGAQLVWEGGLEVFEAGARDVAKLYEYWLFFQLETLFRQRFMCDQPLHALVVNKSKVPPQLELKRGVELRTPVAGVWSETAGRHLRAEFHFNRKFMVRANRSKEGSWSRGFQPDYTISIWPAEYSKEEAEENELMVHVHFDAKYRVEHVRELLGDETDDNAFEEDMAEATRQSGAKYEDLIKMHAYRDAIRRTAGAYVLYPGNPGDGQQFKGFHEVLPGLGAFAVRPDKDGRAEGIDALSKFLDDVIDHLANRTTARERASYHQAEVYKLKELPVPYGSLELPEVDIYGKDYRALPPAEEMVLVAWYENNAQLELAYDETGFVYVRLGLREGALHVHPNFARVRRVLLRARNGIVAPGLLKLREAGFRVYTRKQLRTVLKQKTKAKGVAAWQADAGSDDEEYIYALFQTCADSSWEGQQWNGKELTDLIEIFESDVRNKLVLNLGRMSAYPRVLSFREVLKTRV